MTENTIITKEKQENIGLKALQRSMLYTILNASGIQLTVHIKITLHPSTLFFAGSLKDFSVNFSLQKMFSHGSDNLEKSKQAQ